MGQPQRAILIDKTELCKYIRTRMREERVGTPRMAKALGISQPSLSHGFHGKYIKLDTLEAMLYILDGDTAKWREYCHNEGLDNIKETLPWRVPRSR